jgi:DNA polymerase-3 subunit beta
MPTLTSTAVEIKTAEFTIPAAPFAEAVAFAAKATINGFAAITLAFRDQRVAVQATDLSTTVQIKLPVKGKKSTTVALDAAMLKRFTGALRRQEHVDISITADQVTLQAGDLVYEMRPYLDAPIVVTPDQVNPVDFDRGLFAAAVKVAGVAAGTDAARVILTGILFDEGKAVATDSYRLVVHDAPDFGRPLLIPAKALALAAAVTRDEENVRIDVLDHQVHFVSPLRSVVIRLIDGQYPDWRKLLDTPGPVTVAVERTAIVDRLRKVALAGGDSTPVRLTVGADDIAITIHEVDRANGAAGIPATVDGTLDPVGVNPQYLSELLAAVDVPEVVLHFTNTLKPFTVTADEATWLLLLMPVRIP